MQKEHLKGIICNISTLKWRDIVNETTIWLSCGLNIIPSDSKYPEISFSRWRWVSFSRMSPSVVSPSSRETLETLDDTSDSEDGSQLTISLWSNEATSCHQTTSFVIVVTERPPQKRQNIHTVRLRNSLAFLESNVLLSSSESDENITPHMSTWWSYSLALKRRRLFPN